MSIPSHVEVIVVGGGPAGLTAACALRQNGVNTIVLDAATQPSTTSRATIIHSRTLEVLESLDVTKQIFERGEKVIRTNICDRSANILAKFDFSTLKARYPMMVALPQSETEAILRQKLDGLGGTIFRDVQVTSVIQHRDNVHLDVITREGKKTISAGYVVAADGLKSTVRQAMKIDFEGGEYDVSFVTADCKFSSLGSLVEGAIQLYLSPMGLTLFVPEPHGIWRIVATIDEAPKDADVSLYQRLVDERIGTGVKVDELASTSRFHIHHRLAAKYRKGRVFLAGDAAHVHSPAGGQGMNVGIQDAARLGQILSEAVIEGKSSDVALDRYETERRPVAKRVVALTHRMTVMGTLKSPVLGMLRNWLIWSVMSIPFARSWLLYNLSGLGH